MCILSPNKYGRACITLLLPDSLLKSVAISGMYTGPKSELNIARMMAQLLPAGLPLAPLSTVVSGSMYSVNQSARWMNFAKKKKQETKVCIFADPTSLPCSSRRQFQRHAFDQR
jgi:hypothetical protein